MNKVLLALLGLTLLITDTLPAADQNLLYVARAPRDRSGFRTLAPSLEVFDIDNNHELVGVIPLTAPEGTQLYVFEEDFLGESIEVDEDVDPDELDELKDKFK